MEATPARIRRSCRGPACPQTSLDRALDSLLDKGLVDRITPYSTTASPKNRQYLVADPYLRLWLRFVGPATDTIDRGRGELVVANVNDDYATYRGRAIEPTIREALELSLPDERFSGAHHVGSYWNRTGTIEVDLVAGDARPRAGTISFVGSITWQDDRTFRRSDTAALATQRASVPGADEHTALIGVSRQGFDADAGLDAQLTAEDIIEAYRRRRS